MNTYEVKNSNDKIVIEYYDFADHERDKKKIKQYFSNKIWKRARELVMYKFRAEEKYRQNDVNAAANTLSLQYNLSRKDARIITDAMYEHIKKELS